MSGAPNRGMDVWLSLPFLSAEGLTALTMAAERAGVSGVALSEHPAVPAGFSSPYPYGDGKPANLPTDTLLPDPIVAIAGLATATSTIRFMTAVIIAPLRHPVMLAKEAATAAAMSGGRIDLGVGVGWLREEFEALGNPWFVTRGGVLDEILTLLPKLWTGAPVCHKGAHFTFDAIAVNPTPPQPIPILIGGTSKAAARRCALAGDGWVGANHSVYEIAGMMARLTEARTAADSDNRPFVVRTGLRGSITPTRVANLRDLGVNSFLLAPWQVGERRQSIHDLDVSAIADALPNMVDMITSA
ncbi:TIGR03619 family F420-dependent LLM class oxidoreductase [Mycolicibacterium stellerae]|uniref:TIGR03619 family F420-dependent LLM class oxidoreductase n=1 Tax=Mycolicibacterium stellerae TaxID=2358193 RepID=UPI000F0BBF74|nr:TIGR03619 family F420-dependent LLM class oxidoreductase [Mycolicibacterium stellerae]